MNRFAFAGKTATVISDLVFSDNEQHLALISEKGTMHLFKLNEDSQLPDHSGGYYEKIKGFVKNKT